jgi:hypothetical protein
MKAYRSSFAVLVSVILASLVTALIVSPYLVGNTPMAAADIQSLGERDTLDQPLSVTSVIPLGLNFPIAIGKGGDIQGKPGIAYDGNNFLAVWADSVTYNSIYGARVTRDGVVLDPQSINISVSGNQAVKQPSVSFDGINYLVVWEATRSGISEEYGARVTPDGIVLDPGGVQLTTGADAMIRMPGIAFDGTNFLLVWRTPAFNIRGARISTSENSITNLDPPAGFPIISLGSSRYPAVAFDGENFVVVWHDGRNSTVSGLDIYGTRVDKMGVVLDINGFMINDDPDDQKYPTIDFDGTNYLVGWFSADPSTPQGLGHGYAARLSPDKQVLDDPSIWLGDRARDDFPVQVNCDGTDCLVAFAVEHEPKAKFRVVDIYAHQISGDGEIVNQQRIPISTAFGNQFMPVIGYGGGRYLVAYNECPPGRVYETSIYGQMLEEQMLAAPTTTKKPPASVPKPATIKVANPAYGTWSQEATQLSEYTTAGWAFSATNAFAFGDDIYQYNGFAWEPLGIAPEDYGVWATGPDSLWTAGWCRGFHSYIDGVWGHAGCFEGIATGIWMPDHHQLWATCNNGEFMKSDYIGVDWWNWTMITTTVSADLWDIWGSSAGNIYAIGDQGTLLHYNGVSWSSTADTLTFQSLNAIWGNNPDDIFVVGDFGTILHFDGTSWAFQDSHTNVHLFDVWGVNGSDMYAVGFSGTILHYDGTSWTVEESNTESDLLAVWGVVDRQLPGYIIWAAGGDRILLRKTYPAAAISASPTSGQPPLTVTFTNNSTEGYTSATWDFGDGGTSTLPSLEYTYEEPDLYTVTLDVTWPGWTDRDTRVIQVGDIFQGIYLPLLMRNP